MTTFHRQLLYRALVGTLLSGLLLTGCTAPPHEGTPVFDAWGEDGSGGEYENPDQVVGAIKEYGLIYRFEPGDVIDLGMAINGDVFRSDEPIQSLLRVQKPVWIHSGQQGLSVSFDGKDWKSLTDAFSGALSLDFSISQDDPRNLVFIRLRAEQK